MYENENRHSSKRHHFCSLTPLSDVVSSTFYLVFIFGRFNLVIAVCGLRQHMLSGANIYKQRGCKNTHCKRGAKQAALFCPLSPSIFFPFQEKLRVRVCVSFIFFSFRFCDCEEGNMQQTPQLMTITTEQIQKVYLIFTALPF